MGRRPVELGVVARGGLSSGLPSLAIVLVTAAAGCSSDERPGSVDASAGLDAGGDTDAGGDDDAGPVEPPRCTWLHHYEWVEASQFASVAVDAADNVYVSGETSRGIDFGGGPLDPPGGFVVSFDADGDHRYTRPLVGSDAPWLVADELGNTYLTGTMREAVTIGDTTLTADMEADTSAYVASLDPDGNHRWSLFASHDRTPLEFMYLRLGPDGRLYVFTVVSDAPFTLDGESYQTTGTGTDLLVLVLDTEGNALTHFTVGGPDDELLRGVDVGPDGNLYVYGAYWDTAELGGDPLVSTEDSTTFLASLGPDGGHRWSMGLRNTRTAPAWLSVGDAVYLGIGRGVAFDRSGMELWTGGEGGVGAVTAHPTAGVYVGGFEARPSPSYDRLTLMRLDADGTPLATFTQQVALVSAGSEAAIRAVAARGDSVWLAADGDDAFPGLTSDFTATGMVCRIDALGE